MTIIQIILQMNRKKYCVLLLHQQLYFLSKILLSKSPNFDFVSFQIMTIIFYIIEVAQILLVQFLMKKGGLHQTFRFLVRLTFLLSMISRPTMILDISMDIIDSQLTCIFVQWYSISILLSWIVMIRQQYNYKANNCQYHKLQQQSKQVMQQYKLQNLFNFGSGVRIQYLILFSSRMQKSQSLPRFNSQQSSKESSSRNTNTRLSFPIPGDSAIYSNVGRKHYLNHSDRMLRIILPQKYAIESPIYPRKDLSLPPPHLARHTSQKAIINQKSNPQIKIVNPQPKKFYLQQNSLRSKLEDQLDRTRRSMELKKSPKKLPTIIAKPPIQPPIKQYPQSSKNNQQIENKVTQFYSLTPVVGIKSGGRQKVQLLYNAENKQKYDLALMGRWKNPTNLSTGLSII